MIASYVGHLAALATSAAWTGMSISFTMAGRMVGSAVVNRTRLLLALVFVILTHRVVQGTLAPFDAALFRWGWLGLSGTVGLVIGDAFLFQALVVIGPRLSMLLLSLNPMFSTIIAWIWLGEVLDAATLLGIALVVGGVVLVVSDQKNGKETGAPGGHLTPRQYGVGILLGLGGALCQSIGLVMAKQGLVDNFPALSGNVIRLSVATLAIWTFTILRGRAVENFCTLKENPRALKTLFTGTVVGPFLGVWMSLIAVQKAPVGIASTLMGLAPVLLLPVGHFLFDERITARAIIGTVVAFVGTAILFL